MRSVLPLTVFLIGEAVNVVQTQSHLTERIHIEEAEVTQLVRRGALKKRCLMTCGFESHLRYHKQLKPA